jgi:peptidoglycan/LPS O-acetylase OafA/YrhL
MTKQNNFDFLRFLFAIFVIVSHSYPLSGTPSCDWLCEITKGELQFSDIGVKGFFIISGYLIFQSLLRSKSLTDYFWKRCLRLFPALLIVLLLTVLLAPIVYEGNVSYWENKSIYSYISKNLSLFKLQYSISGVFEKNSYGSAINGSLWTICYEFTMYVLLAALFFFRKNERVLRVAFFVFYSLFAGYFFFLKDDLAYRFLDVQSTTLAEFGLFFLGGSFLALLKFDQFKFLKLATLVSGVLILCSESLIQDPVIFRIVLWPFFIIGIGLQSFKYISRIGEKIGDLSYGIYIYEFPIQQTLMYYFKLNALELMFLSIPISIFFGYLSWHLVEVKMLRYKNVNPLLFFKSIFNKLKGDTNSVKC